MDGVPGWYGKLLARGDFVTRRLPSVWVDRVDARVSRSLMNARAVLGASWDEHFRSAPLLRFVWAPGTVDAQGWLGVLMPSCDAAGRYFPLIVATPHTPLPAFAIEQRIWRRAWRCMALAALSTLEAGSVEDFEARLQRCVASQAGRPAGHELARRSQPWGQGLRSTGAGATLWWPWHTPANQALVCAGWPSDAAVVQWLTARAPAARPGGGGASAPGGRSQHTIIRP